MRIINTTIITLLLLLVARAHAQNVEFTVEAGITLYDENFNSTMRQMYLPQKEVEAAKKQMATMHLLHTDDSSPVQDIIITKLDFDGIQELSAMIEDQMVEFTVDPEASYTDSCGTKVLVATNQSNYEKIQLTLSDHSDRNACKDVREFIWEVEVINKTLDKTNEYFFGGNPVTK